MNSCVVVSLILMLLWESDARRPSTRNLSQCHRALQRGPRDCTAHLVSISRDLRRIHTPGNQYLDVFDRWVADKRRALDPTTNFRTLVTSGACLRMMCFKMAVERYMQNPDYQVPNFCEDLGSLGYRRLALALRRIPISDWEASDMVIVFCAKARDPTFKFH